MSDARPLSRAHGAALRLLSYRPRTEYELKDRLRRRFPTAVVEQVVALLKDEGQLDDARFASQWTAGRESRSPRSAWAIKRELVAKGVERGVADDAVLAVDDDEAAYRAGLKAARTLTVVDSATFTRRLLGYLRRRGFSEPVCRHTIERLRDEAQLRDVSSTGEE